MSPEWDCCLVPRPSALGPQVIQSILQKAREPTRLHGTVSGNDRSQLTYLEIPLYWNGQKRRSNVPTESFSSSLVPAFHWIMPESVYRQFSCRQCSRW